MCAYVYSSRASISLSAGRIWWRSSTPPHYISVTDLLALCHPLIHLGIWEEEEILRRGLSIEQQRIRWWPYTGFFGWSYYIYYIDWWLLLHLLVMRAKKKKKNKKNIEKKTAYNILRGRRFHEPKTWRRASVLPHHQTTGPKNIRVAAEIVCYRIVSSTEERKKSISQHKRDGWKI